VLLTRFCLRNPIAVTLFFAFVAILGIGAFLEMGRSILPPVAIPAVSVAAPYPGAGPKEIERLVIEPIEDQLSQLPDLARVSASAQSGAGSLLVQFRFGSNVDVDRSNVQQAVDNARANMPADLVPPNVSKDDPTQAPILEESISSALLSAQNLSDVVSREVLPALRAGGGVGTVTSSGTVTRQLTVRPEIAPLDALGGTALDVLRAVAAGNDVFSGGTLRSSLSESTIGIDAAATTKRQVEELPLAIPGAASVRVRDVAGVADGYADRSVITRVDGDEAIVLYVAHSPGADSLRTIRNVRNILARLAQRFPQMRFEELRTDEPYTMASIDGVLQTLGEGVALTVAVMLLFLHAWRNALISAIAIPASLCAALLAMWAFGLTVNVLSLMGLSLTIGILVDDSIVIIEAITRNAARGLKPEEAALAGRKELGGVAVAITLVDVAVFMPIALMSGLVGEFMREFGLVIVFATAFSLLVSFTLTPLLAARWRSGRESLDGLSFDRIFALLQSRAKTLPWTFRTTGMLGAFAAWHSVLNAFDAWQERMSELYAGRWLPWAARRSRVLLGAACGICLVSLVPLVVGAIPMEFSPPVNRGEVRMDLTFPPGTPLSATDAASLRLTNALLADPSLKHVEADAGRAFNGSSDVFASNVAQLGLVLSDPRANEDAVVAMVKRLDRFVPGVAINGAGRGMGGTAPISYTVGGDPAVIDTAADRIAAALQENSSATDVRVSNAGVRPRLQIDIDPQRARLLNVSVDDAAQTARIATGGSIATRVRVPSGLVDVVVRSDAASSGSLDALRRYTVRSGDGRRIPLGDLSNMLRTVEPTVIQREGGERIVTVSANAAGGGAIGSIAAALSKRLRDPAFLPVGARIEPRGDVEQLLDTVAKMAAALGISLVAVYLILAVLYQSYTLPFVIMLTVPLASIGALGSLFAVNVLRSAFPAAGLFQAQTLNLYSMLGVVMLVGLVAKNGILLVEFAERALRRGAGAHEAILRAARVRFRPILMTTLAMIAGMLPLALGHQAGAEYRKALGTVVIGGLSSSLLLTLFVVPLAYIAYRNRTMSEAKPARIAASL
jgi:HAE1 family hydrophobic/amphiphilic exporter-1